MINHRIEFYQVVISDDNDDLWFNVVNWMGGQEEQYYKELNLKFIYKAFEKYFRTTEVHLNIVILFGLSADA